MCDPFEAFEYLVQNKVMRIYLRCATFMIHDLVVVSHVAAFQLSLSCSGVVLLILVCVCLCFPCISSCSVFGPLVYLRVISLGKPKLSTFMFSHISRPFPKGPVSRECLTGPCSLGLISQEPD